MYGLGRIEQALFPPLIWTLLGLENMRTAGNIIIRNPLQRYNKKMEYANFETQKMKFFDKNLHISEKCCTFAPAKV